MEFQKKTVFLFTALILLTISCTSVDQYIHSKEVLGWEPEIAVLDSLNRAEPSDENTVLVTGSSSVRLWDSIHSDLSPYRVLQRGYGGAKLSDFNHYADRIIKAHPFKAIVIFVANDISGNDHDRTPREVLKLYQILVDQIRERNLDTPVFWIETTPTPSRWHATDRIRTANRKISRFCEKNPDLYFIDTHEQFTGPAGTPDSSLFRRDMLHLNRKGYRLWARIIRHSLEEEGVFP